MSLVERKKEVREPGNSRRSSAQAFRVGRARSRVARRFCETKTMKIRVCLCHVHGKHIGRSGQNLVSYWMSHHDVFKYFIPLLVVLLQVKVQGTNKSVFETHAAYMWAFLLAAFIYYLAFTAYKISKLHHSNYSLLFSVVAVLSGSFSSVLLLCIFLSCLLGHIIFMVLWTSLSIIVALQLVKIKQACQRLLKILKTISDKFVSAGIWSRFRGSGSIDHPQLPR